MATSAIPYVITDAAETVAALVGKDYVRAQPRAARPVTDVLGPDNGN